MVKDLMHTGENLPLVSTETLMSKTVVEMSSKRLGHCIVIYKNGKMAGVVTDGDVRRGLEKWGSKLFSLASKKIMTKNPKTIFQDELAAKALSIMEDYSITALVVPDAQGKPVGIVHLHDILRQGIA
jgi:arabinose-5-phosphate isomerase